MFSPLASPLTMAERVQDGQIKGPGPPSFPGSLFFTDIYWRKGNCISYLQTVCLFPDNFLLATVCYLQNAAKDWSSSL